MRLLNAWAVCVCLLALCTQCTFVAQTIDQNREQNKNGIIIPSIPSNVPDTLCITNISTSTTNMRNNIHPEAAISIVTSDQRTNILWELHVYIRLIGCVCLCMWHS